MDSKTSSGSARPPKIRRWAVITLYSTLFLLTTLFMVNDGALDKWATSAFYNASLPLGERFAFRHINPWMWFNESEILFDLILVICLSLLIIVGLILIKKPSGKLLLRSGLYMLISALVVVLIVNVLLKNLYGRPRPYQTNLWPDRTNPSLYNFYFVWKPLFLLESGLLGRTESFPSGHTTSMSLFSLLYFVFKTPGKWTELVGKSEKGKKAVSAIANIFKWGGLATSTVGALLMGFSRIVSGYHFVTDIIWALAIVWTVTWTFSRFIFRLYR